MGKVKSKVLHLPEHQEEQLGFGLAGLVYICSAAVMEGFLDIIIVIFRPR